MPERLRGHWQVVPDTLVGEMLAKELSGIARSRARLGFLDQRGAMLGLLTPASLGGSADGGY